MNETIDTHEEKDGGFTLVELLIVIVILGILAAVTVFAVGGITSTARENSCALEQKTISTAIEGYKAANNNAAPASLQVLADQNYLNEAPSNWSLVDGVLTGSGDCAPAAAAAG